VTPRPSPLFRIVASLSRPVLKGLYHYEIRGTENLPAGGFVLAAGHHSNFDPWPLAVGIADRHFVRFMAKSELFWPPLSYVMAAMGAFRVRRDRPDRDAFATARRLAREGNVIAMFPEGTRRSKGFMKRREADVKEGAARIALGAGVPLVPAAVSGTDRLSSRGPLRVLYGAPVPVDDLAGLPRREAARIVTDRLMERIFELEAELARS
jgi:1-acyl-sn-glycerol-3-phosphate acyltransferase